MTTFSEHDLDRLSSALVQGFGVMAAAVMKGEVVAGVIHDPVGGTTALARADAGAWMQDRSGARERMRVAEPVPVADMEGIAGTNFLPQPLRERVSANLPRLRMTHWFRCAAHEYRLPRPAIATSSSTTG